MRVPWLVKILLAAAMTFYLLHLPAMPVSRPEVSVVTITIGGE